jgi:hypothetical protein
MDLQDGEDIAVLAWFLDWGFRVIARAFFGVFWGHIAYFIRARFLTKASFSPTVPCYSTCQKCLISVAPRLRCGWML